MTQRVSLLKGKNITQDYDASKIIEAISSAGVAKGLEVQSGVVLAGFAFVEVNRLGKIFRVLFDLDSDLNIDTTGTKKVFIELNQENIDDGSTNNPNGEGIGEIRTAASYPAKNFIRLASISGGVITDEREKVTRSIFATESDNTTTGNNTHSGTNNFTGGLQLSGNDLNTAGGLVELDAEGKVPEANLPAVSSSGYTSIEGPVSGSIGNRDLVSIGYKDFQQLSDFIDDGHTSRIKHIDGNKYLIQWYALGVGIKAVMADFTDKNNVIYGTTIQLQTITNLNYRYNDFDVIDTTKVISIHSNNSNGAFVRIIEISGMTLTAGATTLSNNTGVCLSIAIIDSGKAVISGGYWNEYATTRIATYSGTTVTVSSNYKNTPNSLSQSYNFAQIRKVDTNKFIMAYAGSSKIFAIVGTVSGTTTTFGTEKIVETSRIAIDMDLLKTGVDEFVLGYGTDYQDLKPYRLTISGTTITSTSEWGIIDLGTSVIRNVRLSLIGGDIIFVANDTAYKLHTGKLGGGFASLTTTDSTKELYSSVLLQSGEILMLTENGEVYEAPSMDEIVYRKARLYDDEKSRVAGFSVGNYSDGDTGEFAIDGILGGFSGLNRRTLYKLSDTVEGTMETSVFSNYLVGRAISDTILKILIYDVNDDVNQS